MPFASRTTVVDVCGELDLRWALGFLRLRRVTSLEQVDEAQYRRTITHDGAPHVVTVAAAKPDAPLERCRAVAIRAAPALPAPVLRTVAARMFDLPRDLGPFHEIARADALLGPLVADRPAVRVPRIPDLFEAIVRAIVGQQVSVAGATTVVDRLVRRFGSETGLRGETLLQFPAAERIGSADPSELTPLGLTRAKAAAIVSAAQAIRDGRLACDALERAGSEEAQRQLDALPGIGPWTASYVRLRGLGDPDAFLEGDLGVLKALQKALRRTELVRPVEALALAERWRPWRAYAALHLWRSLG